MPIANVLVDAEVFTDGDWVESKDQDPGGDVRLTQLADVGDGTWINKSARFLTSEKARQLRCTYLRPGDLLVARMPDPLGRCCVFPGDPMPCVTVVDVCIIRPNQKKVDNRYLMHVINAPHGRHGIARHVTGTTRQRISRKNLGKVQVPLPPLAEQKRIAKILDAADALRVKRRESLVQLDRVWFPY
jgi:type I restriction enzyme S subunit